MREIDAWVCDTLDRLIANVDAGHVESGWLERVHATSRQTAFSACTQLERAKAVADPRQLRMAIDLESDL